jgi:Na+/proline symporter
MKAVIWTDVLQAVVILVGLFATIIQGLIIIRDIFHMLFISISTYVGFIKLGGVKRTFSIASKGGRIQFDRYSFLDIV